MLINNLPETNEDLIVEKTPVEIIISNEGVMPLSLFISPLEDILEMKALQSSHFSLKEHVSHNYFQSKKEFEYELKSLEKKYEKFSNSPIFLNRLANLADYSEQREKEAEFLNLAKNLSSDPFFDHRLGQNLINRNQFLEAEKLFNSLDLKNDVLANLRLAFFRIKRQDFDSASHHVRNALEIDSLDYGARFLEGAIRLIQGKFELAIQSFRAATEERKGSAALYTNMAIAYLYLQQSKKALKLLKRAVTLEPLNENAVMLYTDLAYSEQCNEDSIEVLKKFLQFEQKHAPIWARLARALLSLGRTDEAIAALKHQGSIEDTSSVWNNLGVAYIDQGNHRKAFDALSHAMHKDTNQGKDYLLAARNICHLLAIRNDFKKLFQFSTAILEDSNQSNLTMIKQDRHLSDIIAFYFHSLWRLDKKNEYLELSKDYIYDENVALRLRAWIISILIGYFALKEGGYSEAINLSEQFSFLIEELTDQDLSRKEQLINNIAYAYVDAGRLVEAKHYLKYLTHKIHKDPYPTATLGLMNFRKGNVERGEQLYSEAIQLAHTRMDKIRIRQRLNFELANTWIDKDLNKAKRLLESVIQSKDGSIELAIRAKHLKERLLLGPN